MYPEEKRFWIWFRDEQIEEAATLAPTLTNSILWAAKIICTSCKRQMFKTELENDVVISCGPLSALSAHVYAWRFLGEGICAEKEKITLNRDYKRLGRFEQGRNCERIFKGFSKKNKSEKELGKKIETEQIWSCAGTNKKVNDALITAWVECMVFVVSGFCRQRSQTASGWNQYFRT